jgi:hypothetical protein
MAQPIYSDAVEELEGRIGKHNGRIKHVREIPELEGQKVWLVTAPIDNREGQLISIGTSFLLPYTVGTLFDEKGKRYTKDSIGDLPLNKMPASSFFLSDGQRKWVDAESKRELRCVISMKDYNVLPLAMTNSAIFTSEEDAQKYRLWLKMVFEPNPHLEIMDQRCLCARKVDLEKIFEEGFKDFYKKS